MKAARPPARVASVRHRGYDLAADASDCGQSEYRLTILGGCAADTALGCITIAPDGTAHPDLDSGLLARLRIDVPELCDQLAVLLTACSAHDGVRLTPEPTRA